MQNILFHDKFLSPILRIFGIGNFYAIRDMSIYGIKI